MRPIVVVGAGGHGREMIDIIDAINAVQPTYSLAGVIADSPGASDHLKRRGLALLGGNEVFEDLDALYVLGVGDPKARQALDKLATGYGREAARLVHPTASLGSEHDMGPGFVAFPGAHVTTNVVAGRHVHLNLAATVSHDCVLGDYVTLSPGCHLAGNVRLGDRVTLGVGAVILPGVSVGCDTYVGAGAVVVEDLPDGVVAVGVPARARE